MAEEKKRHMIYAGVGIFLIIFGFFYGFYADTICFKIMEHNLVLTPNSEIFRLWKTPPIRLTIDIYIFNWTNPEDFHDSSIKPRFDELGPYRFIEYSDKVDIKWHPENASMTYRKKNKYVFDAAASKGTLNDKIVTINMLAVSASAKAQKWDTLRRRVLDIGLHMYSETLMLKKTVNELIFEGYEDMLLNVASFIPSSITDVNLPFDRFGYLYPRNGSSEVTGVFNMFTGEDDVHKFGQIHSWNYQEATTFYKPECAKVEGSPGEFHSPYLQKHKPITYFLSDLCRSVKLDYTSTQYVEGVEGYRYEGGQRLVDNGTLYPENECHCNGRCLPSGVVNISSCWFDAPVFVSYPHFFDADPYYLSQVEGLTPIKDKHELYLVLEHNTGLMLEMAGRLQSNILLEPITEFSSFRHNRTILFPLFWFEGRTRITPALASDFKMLPRFILCGQIFGVLCSLIGILLFAWQPFAAYVKHRLMQEIKINNLEHEEHCITGKGIGTSNEIAPFLIRAVQENARMLTRADTTISSVSLTPSDTDTGDSNSAN